MALFVAIMALCGAVASFLMTWVFLTVVGLAVMPAYALVMIWQGMSLPIALGTTLGGFVALQVAYALMGALTEFRRDGSTSAIGADRGLASRFEASPLRRGDDLLDGAGSGDSGSPHDSRDRIERPSSSSRSRLGGWLPLVAIRHVPCRQDGSPWNGREDPGYRIRIFVIAWLGRGSSISLGRPARASSRRYPTTDIDSTIASLDTEVRHQRERQDADRSTTNRSPR